MGEGGAAGVQDSGGHPTPVDGGEESFYDRELSAKPTKRLPGENMHVVGPTTETVIYSVSQVVSLYFSCQILGFDVILDEKLHPFLLEVNAHPSLRVDFEQPLGPGRVEYVPSPVDLEIKLPVVRDTLTIIGGKIRRWVGL